MAKGQKLILLEPRRIAARSAASRMARELGEQAGETIGLRVRLGSKIGPKTRIEVVTEGVFNRMILDDPMLEGIAAVLFDEFHERSLDGDLGLALALDAQTALRPDLRLIVMSATLDGARVSGLLGQGAVSAPVIESLGRSYPVETRHIARDPVLRLEDQITSVVIDALQRDDGSLLVFLPGQGEIRRVEERLQARLSNPAIFICPLYGAMDPDAQDRAIAPCPDGMRKIVLATAIAETSLTIEGVRIVIDSGLSRVPVYEPDLGLTRLETVRVSRAAADQRRGRAGRTAPGICYRLWLEAATGAMAPFSTPEILSADLTSLTLDCASWGTSKPETLPFLDAPPAPALKEARTLLTDIQALDPDGRLTTEGKVLRALALPTRLARMVVSAVRINAALTAAELAACLVERGLGGDAIDLAERLDCFRTDRSARATDMRRLAREWAVAAGGHPSRTDHVEPGLLLALAFPERIAKARSQDTGRYLLANGRGAILDPLSRLARAPYLVVAEMSGSAAQARILSAAAIDEADILHLAQGEISEEEHTVFDHQAKALRTRGQRRYRALVLAERPLPTPANESSAQVLAEAVGRLGMAQLPWSAAQIQLRTRMAFLRAAEGELWPDVSDNALGLRVQNWLAPHLVGRTSVAGIDAACLGEALAGLLDWEMKRRLDEAAPTHFEAPTGTRAAVDYGNPAGPAISIRVQELFGLKQHPALARGTVPLVLELLSPGHKPIQVTRNLPGFWKGSWASVKSEMKGRYPRHPWPDDPSAALPTTRAKPRGT